MCRVVETQQTQNVMPPPGGGVLPYICYTGKCSQGMVFSDFTLEQGMVFSDFTLEQGIIFGSFTLELGIYIFSKLPLLNS